jgi:uncharacterized protein (TIGR03083 family)
MDDKEQILNLLKAEFDRWEALLAGLSEEQLADPSVFSGWSVKDVLAHLWSWQLLSVARLEAALQGKEPVIPRPPQDLDFKSEDDLDQINAWFYATSREKPWTEVHADWRANFLRLLELGEQIPAEDLLAPGRYAWLDGWPLSAVLSGSYEHHHIDHLGPLLAGLNRQ